VAGKLTQAGAQSAQALELDPDNPLTQATTAAQAMTQAEDEKCVEHARNASKLGFSRVVNVLESVCLARLDRLDEASRALRPAIDPLQKASGLRAFADALPGSEGLALGILACDRCWRQRPSVRSIAADACRERLPAFCAAVDSGGIYVTKRCKISGIHVGKRRRRIVALRISRSL